MIPAVLLLAAGAVPPPVPRVNAAPGQAADAFYDTASMTKARALLRHETGGLAFSMVMVDLLELQTRRGRDGYRFEGQGWWGTDVDRLTVNLRAEGDLRRDAEEAAAEIYYARAIGPWFNLEAGVRQDIEPRIRTYAAIGVQGLAPYQLETQAVLFLSDRGKLIGRVELSHDMRLTQRLILTPRAELNWAAQRVPERGWGRGLAEAELGLRLHYAFVPRFAPYVGTEWQRRPGGSGDDAKSVSFVTGIRAWF